MVFYPDAPKDLVSASELIAEQQAILAKNGENQRKRENLAMYEKEVEDLRIQMQSLQTRLTTALENLEMAQKSALDLHDESTEELEENIANIDRINVKVRANLDKEKAEIDAAEYKKQYDELTEQIEEVRKSKTALLDNADLPLEGLSVQDGDLTYNGFKWDNMSASEQLKVSTAIVRKLNPNCGFVLLDKLEQMDVNTLNSFSQWLEQEGLQAIATRVSTGDECSIIIEDGYAVTPKTDTEPSKKWETGKF